jgi:hypothetical protein
MRSQRPQSIREQNPLFGWTALQNRRSLHHPQKFLNSMCDLVRFGDNFSVLDNSLLHVARPWTSARLGLANHSRIRCHYIQPLANQI